jgi:hypothetical protein
VRNCKKVESTPASPRKEDQWQAVSRKFGNVGNKAPSSSTDPSNVGSKFPSKAIENPRKSRSSSSHNNFESLSQLADSEVEVIPAQSSIGVNNKELPSVQEVS